MALQYAASVSNAIYVRELSERDYLDDILDQFLSGDIENGMSRLEHRLYDLYTMTSSKEWKSYVSNELFKHRLKNLVLQDPLTARSLAKPRGYAGDARLLDMIYFPSKVNLASTSPIGRAVFKFTSRTNISRDLRKRKQIVADSIDQAAKTDNLQVLSVASGHCREIELSKSIRENNFERFICLDQDLRSLTEIDRKYSCFGINTVASSIADMIKGNVELGKFNLIYSAGLYDYLSNRLAKKLTKFLYNSLLPGGKLILFNVVQNYKEIGFFESLMDWPLIGRDESQMLAFADDLPSSDIASIYINNINGRSFNYIELTKN